VIAGSASQIFQREQHTAGTRVNWMLGVTGACLHSPFLSPNGIVVKRTNTAAVIAAEAC
jgi:uncharacterized membrane protein YeaQ/YmgE (transglycosylase-associated protein family)